MIVRADADSKLCDYVASTESNLEPVASAESFFADGCSIFHLPNRGSRIHVSYVIIKCVSL